MGKDFKWNTINLIWHLKINYNSWRGDETERLHRSAVGNPGIFNSSKSFIKSKNSQYFSDLIWIHFNQTLCLCVYYSWDKKKIWLRSKRSISRKENITRIPRIPRSSPTQEKAVYKSKWFSPVCSQTSPPAGPEDKVPLKMRQLLSRCPHGAMLLQHGPESGGHHGRGQGRSERS